MSHGRHRRGAVARAARHGRHRRAPTRRVGLARPWLVAAAGAFAASAAVIAGVAHDPALLRTAVGLGLATSVPATMAAGSSRAATAGQVRRLSGEVAALRVSLARLQETVAVPAEPAEPAEPAVVADPAAAPVALPVAAAIGPAPIASAPAALAPAAPPAAPVPAGTSGLGTSTPADETRYRPALRLPLVRAALWEALAEPPDDPPAPATNGQHRSLPASVDLDGGPAANGTVANGTAVNGTVANGTAVNGGAVNGTAVNGTAVHGRTANGTAANGTAANGSAANGTVPDSPAANGTVPDGPAANGPAANGTVPDGPTANGATRGSGAHRRVRPFVLDLVALEEEADTRRP